MSVDEWDFIYRNRSWINDVSKYSTEFQGYSISSKSHAIIFISAIPFCVKFRELNVGKGYHTKAYTYRTYGNSITDPTDS